MCFCLSTYLWVQNEMKNIKLNSFQTLRKKWVDVGGNQDSDMEPLDSLHSRDTTVCVLFFVCVCVGIHTVRVDLWCIYLCISENRACKSHLRVLEKEDKCTHGPTITLSVSSSATWSSLSLCRFHSRPSPQTCEPADVSLSSTSVLYFRLQIWLLQEVFCDGETWSALTTFIHIVLEPCVFYKHNSSLRHDQSTSCVNADLKLMELYCNPIHITAVKLILI